MNGSPLRLVESRVAGSQLSYPTLATFSTNRNGWPLIFAMISYDKKMKNQIGYRDSLHDEYDEG